jgi:formylglycine-generating enzyme required for sulfatase activity
LLAELAADEARRREAEQRKSEEAARLAAQKAQEEHNRAKAEARYIAEGRIRVAAPIARPAGLEWFLPGAGREESFKDADFAPEMVIVPAGEFWMGSKEGEGAPNECPRHKVKIPWPFAVGRYAVTFNEWYAAVSTRGVQHKPSDQGWGRGRRPVINVNCDDAQAYIKWLSSKTGQPYRLLSEAEWEYCCRAGTETAYFFGNNIAKQQAQFSEGRYGSAGKTVEVGSFSANAFGLHDMHGNVWEWCEDCWNDSYHNAPSDGSAWRTEGRRVLRGGSWVSYPRDCRAAHRYWNSAFSRDFDIGFRVARTLNY